MERKAIFLGKVMVRAVDGPWTTRVGLGTTAEPTRNGAVGDPPGTGSGGPSLLA